MAVALLVTPNLSATQQAQAVQFANQAVTIASQALQSNPTSTLADIVTTSTAPAAPTMEVNVVPQDAGGTTDTGTNAITETIQTISPTMPKTISVSFESSTQFVTITNDTGTRVRVVNLDVDGTLEGFGFSGSQYQYAPSFTDAMEKTFTAFACTGLGSEGMAILPQQGPTDPCRRKDANLARNEIEPGETMTLRYADAKKITYQPGSIVEVDTGADVQF